MVPGEKGEVKLMKTRDKATIEDLYRYDGKAELVNGEIVPMAATGLGPGYAGGEIFVSLHEYARDTKLGYAITDNVGFVVKLPHRQSFSPDVGFYIGPITMKFAQGAPVFAVEIRSEGDYGPAQEKEIAQKRLDYFAAGTEVVWDVDLLGQDVVRVYRRSDPTKANIYHRGEEAEAEPALPGWRFPVDDLFPGQ
jgi:Uma2 family endonuclease